MCRLAGVFMPGRDGLEGQHHKKGASKKAPLCNFVTDYRTFIEDFQRLVQFVDYLDAREEYLPPIH